MSRCSATKKDGTPCRAFALSGFTLCLFQTDRAFLKRKVYTEYWTIDQRICLLKRRLYSTCLVKEEQTRSAEEEMREFIGGSRIVRQ